MIQCDVIVGADGESPCPEYPGYSVQRLELTDGIPGLWSTLRDQLLGYPSPPLPTGDLAYRMTLSGEILSQMADPSLQELMKVDVGTAWLGPDKHCVFYPIRNRKEWNLVLM